MLQGDFGRSFRTGQTVLQADERLPVSLELMVLAEIMGLAIGVPLAILRRAQRQRVRSLHDRQRLRLCVFRPSRRRSC
jgi:ABC-type dipeptide/oligopeptide/nickel transport system permease component